MSSKDKQQDAINKDRQDSKPFLGEEELAQGEAELEEVIIGEEKVVPPVLYTCIHTGDRLHCEFWDLHTDDPYYYPYVNDDTPCHFCGHRGTLRVYLVSN